MEKKYSVVDLFCGIRGMSVGFEKAGFEITYAADIDYKKTSIYNQILKENICTSVDIFEIPFSAIPVSDIIIGGFPCPGFTHATTNHSHPSNTFTDYFLELIDTKKPKAFLLETVIMPTKVFPLDTICNNFQKIGYNLSYQILESIMYSNLPAYERKTYIVGIRNDICNFPYRFPVPNYKINMNHTNDWIENNNDIDLWYRKPSILNKYILKEGNFYIKKFNKIYETTLIYLSRNNTNYLCDTKGIRQLTHNEIAYLKGLPEYDYNNFTSKYTMYNYLIDSSNAYIINALAKQLLCYLNNTYVDYAPIPDAYQLSKPSSFMTLLTPPIIMDFNSPTHESSNSSQVIDVHDEWTTLIEAIDNVSLTSKERGSALEELMVKFFSQIEGFSCRKNKRTQTEEIDIVIVNQNRTSAFANESPLFLCECKNHSTPVSRKELNIFIEKMKNRNRRCKLGFFVAWNGVIEDFSEELLRKSESDNLIILLEKAEITKAIHEQNFLDFLVEKYYDVILF